MLSPSKVSFKITDKDILSKVSSYDIFKYYIHNFKELGRPFCSELRRDRNPSCTVYQTDSGNYRYKDFSNGDNLGCFNYVMEKFHCTFPEALLVIGNDFNLIKSDIKGTLRVDDTIPVLPTKPSVKKKETKIIPEIRSWNIGDVKYWSQYGIDFITLEKFDVKPCESVSINDWTIYEKPESPIYIYNFNGLYKIYRPLETIRTKRWFSNTNKETIQGFNQLPEFGDLLIITKSLKDVICFANFGYSAVSFSSESTIPSDEQVNMLSDRFKTIKVLYDLDDCGVKFAQKLKDKYNFDFAFIPKRKDLSDYIKFEGLEEAKILIDSLI